MKVWLAILPLFIISATFGQNNANKKPATFKLKDSTAAIGSVCVLRDITLKYDTEVDTSSFKVMDSIIRFLKRNPKIKIEVSSHLNPTEGQMCYMSLRALAVTNYLIKHSIDSVRVIPKEDYGEFPIVPAKSIKDMKTDKERQKALYLNERFQLTIIGTIKK